jgi:hypothetical protein
MALLWFGAADSHAQIPTIRGYYLNVPLWSDSSQYAVGGFGDLQRLRVMTAPTYGQLSLDVAYEHVLQYSQRAVSAPIGAVLGGLTPGGGEYLDLQWTIKEADHWLWRHRFDRLNLRYSPNQPLEVTVGRQTISWATTLFLTPADPFVPFDPADPFRVYRAGVDAVRLQAFLNPLSDLDFVVRPTKYSTITGTDETSLTILGRGRSVWRGWEVSAWAGMLHSEAALALGASGGWGATAIRAEVSIQESEDRIAVRGTIGVDRLYSLFSRDLYLVLEYQHDDFGAASSSELVDVILSQPFARGQLQVLGQDEIAGQAAYQIHPLLNLSLLLLFNLNDPSSLVFPAFNYSASNEIAIQGGLFLGVGKGTPDDPLALPSEYGITPTSVWVSVTAFF